MHTAFHYHFTFPARMCPSAIFLERQLISHYAATQLVWAKNGPSSTKGILLTLQIKIVLDYKKPDQAYLPLPCGRTVYAYAGER